MIETYPLGLGIKVDSDSTVLAPDSHARHGLFAVGALTAGQFWEITAVPDIRVQTRKVSEKITRIVQNKQQNSASNSSN